MFCLVCQLQWYDMTIEIDDGSMGGDSDVFVPCPFGIAVDVDVDDVCAGSGDDRSF